MDHQDVTFYISCEAMPNDAIVKKILNSCPALDLSGSQSAAFYNGLEGFGDDVEYEFEIKPDKAIELAEKYSHNNFTFLEWHNDELFSEISDLLEEIGEKSSFKTDSISLLTGPHEILSLDDNKIVKSEFSFAFYSESPLKIEPADMNLTARKDKDLLEKIAMLEDICKTKFNLFYGGS